MLSWHLWTTGPCIMATLEGLYAACLACAALCCDAALQLSVLLLASAAWCGAATSCSTPPPVQPAPLWQAGPQQRLLRCLQASRRILGVVEPGGRLPLPYDWSKEGSQLQVRPVLELAPGEEGGETSLGSGHLATHGWSFGTSYGTHSVLLSGLEEGATRLLCCKPMSRWAAARGYRCCLPLPLLPVLTLPLLPQVCSAGGA